MNKDKTWKRVKITTGAFFLLLVVVMVLLLFRMAAVRAAMEYPDSELSIAQAPILMAAGACLIMAAWCFISLKLNVKNKAVRYILLVGTGILSVACLAFFVFAFSSVASYYAQWPGGALFT